MPAKKTNPPAGFFMLGMLLGAAVGAAIGLLYAPQPGSDSRHELADWAEQQAARARTAADEATGEERAGAGDDAPSGDAGL
jgi:gas vesicle protein